MRGGYKDKVSIRNLIDRRCIGCNSCLAVCPKNAIEIVNNINGFWYANVKEEFCINCGRCIKVCPVYGRNSILFSEPKSYAAWNERENIRKNSSSGGMFSAIASHILKKGGIVYGAAYEKDFTVEHIRISNEKELHRLQGSKYIQSLIRPEIYLKIIQDLKNSRIVLFSGTPCQTAAINSYLYYLEKDLCSFLITVDVLCHGVPSQKAWSAYLSEICEKKHSTLCSVNMRDKSCGWNKFHVKLCFSDGTEHDESFHEGIWGPSYFTNLFLRDCCFQCEFKNNIRQADITLGDFWGAARETELRKYDDNDKGTSIVLVNSAKGEKILDSLELCHIEKIPYKCILKGLYVLYKSSSKNFFSKKAFVELDNNKPFSKIVNETLQPSFVDKVMRRVWILKEKLFAK